MATTKVTEKDRYGNLRSLEIKTEGNNLEVPPMASGIIPQYEARGGDAATHPGGPKGSDTVPAWLTPGEFVVNKEATDLFGPQIEQMNDIGREIQDGNMSPDQAPPVYASTGKEVEDRKIKIYKHLANEWGLPDNQIAAIMGQIYHESAESFDPFRLEDKVPEHQRGEGLFQNTPGSTRMLEPYHQYLIKEGINKNEMTEDQAIKAQLDFFMKSFMDFGTTGDKDQRVLPGKNPVVAHGWKKANLMRDTFADTDLRTLAVKTDSNPSLTGRLTSFINVPNDALDARNIATEKMLEEINSGKYSDYSYQEDLGNMPTTSSSYIPGTNILNLELGVETPPVDGGPGFWDWLGGVLGTHTNQEKNRPIVGGAPNTFIEKPAYPNKGGPIHAYSGQKVRYRDQWGNPIYPGLEEEVNRILPYAEQYITAGAGKGDGDDLGTEPTSLRVPPMEEVPYNIPSTEELQKAAEIYDKRMKKEKVQELYQDAGIGGKSITPAAKVFMGMGDSMLQDSQQQYLFTDLDNIPKVQEENLDTTVKTLENALATGDTNLIGSASNAVEDAAGALSTANITVAANKTNDAEWKHKYAVSDAKLIEEQIAAISALEAQALANGNPMLANQYRMTKEKLIAESLKKKKELDKAETNLTNASESEAEVLKDNVITNEAITSEVKEKKLKELVNQVEDAKLIKMYRHLNRMKSKIDEIHNAGPANPRWEQTKGMLNFLFGDLIDGREIGRAIAIYLASRALGYEHGESIGFVAKQYLERVDTKNAQLDKFIRENAGKFTQESLAEYKRTRGRSKLIPIGKAPRYQGEKKVHYSKEYPNGRMAYKMKLENADGKDDTYWSWSRAGNMPISADTHSDPRRVIGTPEYDARLLPMVNQIQKQLESDAENTGDKYKTGEDKWGTAEWTQHTALNPSASAWSIARWAEENGFRLQDLMINLPQAYALMVEDTKRKKEEDKNFTKPRDIIPYLEDSMIKPLLTSRAAELVTANVNNEVVSTDTEKLKEINRKANQLAKQIGTTTTNFWNVVMEEWNSIKNDQYKDTDMTHKQEYIKEYDKKKDKGLTPFALFAQDFIDLKFIKINEEKS
tara:strand:+ start:2085 stop:5339 length:3255 start_codon:yes stop_codon:yes gene_type:complete